MEALVWTMLALLGSAHNNHGHPTTSLPALTSTLNLDEVTSVALHLTPKVNVSIVPPNQNNSSQTFHHLNTHTTVGTEISVPPSSTNPYAPGHITSQSTERAAAEDTSPTLVPGSNTTVAAGSTINTTSASTRGESHTSFSPSTINFSEKTSVAFSVLPSSISSSPIVLTEKTKTTEPISLKYPHQDTPSELDVGDEDSAKVPRAFPLDPLLAGLTSIFIVSTALVAIVLFLRFRQQNGRPEFQRLQDLPMDDLLEDTPLSRYAY